MTMLYNLSDFEISKQLEDLRNELRRRAAPDPVSMIRGQEYAKRAVLVAAAGRHSILLVGPPGTGKTMLRAMAAALGLHETFEAHPCACGYRSDPRHVCNCEPESVTSWYRGLPRADMLVEVDSASPAVLLESPFSEGLAEYQKRLARISDRGRPSMSRDGATLLKCAINDLSIDMPSAQAIERVAGTIAELEGAGAIQPWHVAEAVGYRPRYD